MHKQHAQKLATRVVDLWLSNDIISAKRLCERRINELKSKGYTPAYLAKLQTIYRGQIVEELRGRGLVWNVETRSYEYRPKSATTEPRENYQFSKFPISLFGGAYEYSTGRRNSSLREAVDRKNDTTENNVEIRNRERVPVTSLILDAIYDRVSAVLTGFVEHPTGSKKELYDVAVAIVFATGRRPFLEVLQDLRFETREQDPRLDVVGISKKGDLAKSNVYQVNVVGVDPVTVKKAHDRLIETLTETCAWYSGTLDPDKIRNSTGKQMTFAIGAYRPLFNEVVKAGWGAVLGSLHPHDARAIYVQQCIRQYQTKTGVECRDEDEFAGNVLIHETKTRDGQTKRSNKSAHFYKRFIYKSHIPTYVPVTTSEIIL